MKRIVWNEPERVARFVAALTGEDEYRASVAIGLECDGELVAGVVYQLYTGPGGSLLMHVASDGTRRWMTRAYLSACFRYPFVQMRCRRVTGSCAPITSRRNASTNTSGSNAKGCCVRAALMEPT
ncbi:hypothetical protein AB1286_33185 [Trinickia sp. NRRL B-1857]|uniref:hypothetical protein n=1 Tax=Trinickia sp. NRRL B-1857 TaxID=3162879 RepID=UPI003D29FC1F